MNEKITGIILAGGEGKRLKGKKLHLEIDGEKIIKKIIEKIRGSFYDLILIINDFNSFDFNIKKIKDVILGKGPIGGIYTGLLKSKTKYNFFFACDMPFLNTKLIDYMMGIKKDYDILVPKIGKRFEPLHSIYSKDCIEKIKEQIDKEDLEINHLFKKLKTKYVSLEEIKIYDPNLLSFYNINNFKDFEKALKLKELL